MPSSREHRFDKKDWDAFSEEFAHESDRASALLGAAALDVLLGRLIASFLVEDKEAQAELLSSDRPYAPLGTLASRITAAYCLGLIDRIQYQDLKAIKRIRNTFAHGLHGISFKDEVILKEVKKLKTHLMACIPKGTKEQFLLTVLILTTDLDLEAAEIAKERRTVPSHYDFIDEGGP